MEGVKTYHLHGPREDIPIWGEGGESRD
jgi:hypothetical protein